MVYLAHSGAPSDKSDWQSLRDHLRAVAELAAEFARPLGLEKAAYLAGLFHDLGKYDPAFQKRLEGADIRVDHSTAGAVVLTSLVREAIQNGHANDADAGMAELLAYCVLGHHAGLPDRLNEFGHCFDRRIDAFENKLDPVWKTEIGGDVSGIMPEQTAQTLAVKRDRASFDLSVVARMIFSCLVDADFKDTERYYAALLGRVLDREWTELHELLPEFTRRFDAHVGALHEDSDLGRLRHEVLVHVRGKASMGPGPFTLTVPTGGGKTLASLGFALDHASCYGHRRIIYAIPFTSVIDQVAGIFRDLLGKQHVLEHHCAIGLGEESRHVGSEGTHTGRDRLKLAMEDWAAPVVVTTNVQFFESLFAARASRARKLHNIANSVVILDEAQAIPRHLLRPCVRMLDTLARHFGCTIVLCTATQPALGTPSFPGGLDLDGRELAPHPRDLARRLRRVRIERVGEMNNDALIAAVSRLPRGLVIVNTRKHALELYREAEGAGIEGLVHLTTRQCAVHRRAILAGIRHRLKAERPCRVIATSLIEAGIDIDFPAVWRAEAGLDSIVQAAGRCNREGRQDWRESVVHVFRAPEHPPPSEIAGLVGDMGRMVDLHDDLLSLEAIQAYFGEVYWRAGAEKLDAKEILKRFRIDIGGTDFAYRTVAEDFRMIESTMQPVIVPFDEDAIKTVEELAIERISSGRIARKLQTYIVQVPSRARDLLIRNGHVSFERPDLRGDQFAVLTSAGLYRGDVGLLWEEADYLAAENSIV